MAFRTYTTLIKVLIAALLLGVVPNCSSDAPDDKSVTEIGTVRMPLQATGNSGAQYRLEEAAFNFSSMSSFVGAVADPDQQTLEVDLPIGSYQVELLDGWQMSRLTGMGVWTPVDATLTSPNPTPAIIANQAVTDILYVFNVGDEQIPFGFGRARVRIAVNETGSSLSCDLDVVVPPMGCSIGDPAACVCVGCNDDGVCDETDDCYCSDCLGSPNCGCNFDGVCSIWAESCSCGDCAAHASCPGGGPTCGNGMCEAGEPCACADCSGTPACSSGFMCGLNDPPAPTGPCTGDDASCTCLGCVDDGICGIDEDCLGCADCEAEPFCQTNCNNDGLCDPYVEDCPCSDCAAHPLCAGSAFMCGLNDPPAPTGPCTGDAASCSCLGCVDDGICGIDEDCLGCADCVAEPFCQANCNNDGLCDPYVEDCPCADCAAHPLCP